MLSKPKLRSYVKFKSEYKTESYIVNIRNRCQRSIIAKLRCGILQLHIETGRFDRTLLQDRTCQICKNGDIEDEVHFICTCLEYSKERFILYSQMERLDPKFKEKTASEKFIFIVNSGSKYFAKYLLDAWKIRLDVMYQSK